jgi:hypothetical protein
MRPSGATAAERLLAQQADSMAKDSADFRGGRVPKWSAGLGQTHAAITANRKVSLWAADPRMSPFNPNRFAPQGPAQIPEGVLAPAYFQQDRAGKKLLGGMAGNEFHEFNQRQKEIRDARNFLQKQTRPALTMGRFGVFPQEAVKSIYEQIFDSESLQAFEKLEKSVGQNTKQQNAGTAALKGSQEAIAIIARSEGMGKKEDMGARVERVMNAVKDEMKRDADNAAAMKEALNKWLEKNPGVISREP